MKLGMFIFAELLANFLESLPTLADLYREFDPTRLPVKLDHVYDFWKNYIVYD
jgi:hypothetical protein